MLKLSHLPLLKIVLPFIAGIFFFDAYPCRFFGLFIIGITFLVVLLVSHFTMQHFISRKVNAVIVIVFVFLCGGLLFEQKQIENTPDHFSKYQASFAKGIISKPLEEKDRSFRTIISITQVIDSNNHTHPAEGNLLIYLSKEFGVKIDIGDEVLIPLKYNEVECPKNPGQFDFRNFLKYRGAYHQQYSGNLVIITKKHSGLFIQRVSNNIGVYVQSILKKYIPGKERFSLADGILLGHRADIDPELYNAFAYTGILHILSVSGLHVGIIYALLVLMLSFIKEKNRKIKIGKFIFIFLFIWMFTFVTGSSAACVRAAILFSLLNYGKLAKENVNNLNILCGACLLQLLIGPNSLFDIGFQLSYLAMVGLFIFYKPVYALYYHPNKLIDWTWKLWSASIAAQIFTVPLSIYYFGNFPTYFLFANIFAIPLSTLILCVSLSLVPLSFIPFAAHIVGWIDSQIISAFIYFARFFSNLPLGKLTNLFLLKWQLIVLLIAVTSLIFFVITRKTKFAFYFLLLCITAIIGSYYYNLQQLTHDEIVLYSVPKNLCVGINVNNKQFLISKDSVAGNTFAFSIKNSYRNFRVDQHYSFLLSENLNARSFYNQKDLLYVRGKSFYFMNRSNSRTAFKPALGIDYLVITDNCYLDIETIQSNYEFKHLILSGDNNKKHIEIYRKLLSENGIQYVDVSKSAYVVALQ